MNNSNENNKDLNEKFVKSTRSWTSLSDMKNFINQGVDVNYINSKGETALTEVLSNEKAIIFLEEFFSNNVDVNIGGVFPPLILAVYYYGGFRSNLLQGEMKKGDTAKMVEWQDIIKFLITNGGDANYVCPLIPVTPMSNFVLLNEIELLNLAIENGASLKDIDNNNENLITLAFNAGNLKMIKFLLFVGAPTTNGVNRIKFTKYIFSNPKLKNKIY